MANPTNRILWLALVFSQIAYMAVAAVVHIPPNAEAAAVLVPVLSVLAPAVAAGTVVYRRRALVEPIRSGALDPSTPEGLARASTPFLLNLVLSESIGIYGLLLTFFSGELGWMLAFGAGALGLLWLHRPTAPELVPPPRGYRTAPPIG
jgi:hypothetical protein